MLRDVIHLKRYIITQKIASVNMIIHKSIPIFENCHKPNNDIFSCSGINEVQITHKLIFPTHKMNDVFYRRKDSK